MKTLETQFQLLLDQTSALYESQQKLSGIFEARAAACEPHLKNEFMLEAEENKKQCTKLEGLVNVLKRNPHKNCKTEASWKQFVNEFTATLKRIISKHASFGYQTAIFVALALGQNEIANFLKCCLSSGSVVFIK
jgi:hypothetical protein